MNTPAEQLETTLNNLRFRSHLRVFPVTEPVTLYVRGSHCAVVVQYHQYDHVEIYASLYAAFGMRLIVEQDEDGVYVVVKRRRLLGFFSRSEVQVVVPAYCDLAFDLSPGNVTFEGVSGVLEIPAFSKHSDRKQLIDSDAQPALTSHTSPAQLNAGQPHEQIQTD
jgi:hypothetical protein